MICSTACVLVFLPLFSRQVTGQAYSYPSIPDPSIISIRLPSFRMRLIFFVLDLGGLFPCPVLSKCPAIQYSICDAAGNVLQHSEYDRAATVLEKKD